jgi:hypothetical protein
MPAQHATHRRTRHDTRHIVQILFVQRVVSADQREAQPPCPTRAHNPREKRRVRMDDVDSQRAKLAPERRRKRQRNRVVGFERRVDRRQAAHGGIRVSVIAEARRVNPDLVPATGQLLVQDANRDADPVQVRQVAFREDGDFHGVSDSRRALRFPRGWRRACSSRNATMSERRNRRWLPSVRKQRSQPRSV